MASFPDEHMSTLKQKLIQLDLDLEYLSEHIDEESTYGFDRILDSVQEQLLDIKLDHSASELRRMLDTLDLDSEDKIRALLKDSLKNTADEEEIH